MEKKTHGTAWSRTRWLAAATAALALPAIFAGTGTATPTVAPVNTSPPTITGTPQVGQELSADPGEWTGTRPMTFTGQWQRCNEAGAVGTCVSIAGANDPTYRVQPADEGRTLRVRITARNRDGNGTAFSRPTAVVRPAPANAPSNISAPTISGTPKEGETLTGNRGEWENNPGDYNLNWQRCDKDGLACANIAGATGNTYKLTSADVGNTVRLRVIATNAAGRTTAFSRATAVIAPKAGGPPSDSGPSGQIKLPDGRTSIPVTEVKLPERLIISQLDFRPNPLRSRSETIVARFRVADTRGYVIRGALVFAIPLPYGWTTQPAETTTGTDGWAEVRMQAKPALPRKGAIVMFVRARKQGDSVLAGVSTRRLVQMLVDIR